MVNLRRTSPGAPILPYMSAKWYNATLDNIAMNKGVQGGQAPEIDPDIILINNNTGQELKRFYVVGLGEAPITPTNNDRTFENLVFVQGEAPSEVNHEYKWGIVQDPRRVDDERPARCVASGFTQCTITLTQEAIDNNWRRVTIQNNDVVNVHAAETGLGEIIWIEQPGTPGNWWGIIRIDAAGADGPVSICVHEGPLVIPRLECEPNQYWIPPSPGEEHDCCDPQNPKGLLIEYLDRYVQNDVTCKWDFEYSYTPNRIIACCDPDCQFNKLPDPIVPPGCNACPPTPARFFPQAVVTAQSASGAEQWTFNMRWDAANLFWYALFDQDVEDGLQVAQRGNVRFYILVECFGAGSFCAADAGGGNFAAIVCDKNDLVNPYVNVYDQPCDTYHQSLTVFGQMTANGIEGHCGRPDAVPNDTGMTVQINLPDCQ